MKKVLTIFVAALILFSCAVSVPSWVSSSKEGVYVETCRDTIGFDKLDSVFKSHHIKPTIDEWALMKFYNTKEDNMSQWTYTCKDTIYTVTGIDSLYIFTKRNLMQPVENK